LILKGYRRK